MKKYRKDVYNNSGTLAETLIWLGELKQSDSWGSTRSCGGCLVAALGFGGCTLQTLSGGHGGGFSLITMVAVVGGFVAFNYYNSFDTEDRRYQLPTELLQTLQEQLDSSRPVNLKVDFRDTAQSSFQIEQVGEGNNKKVRYRQPWLDLQFYTRWGPQVTVKICREQVDTTLNDGKENKVVKRGFDLAEMSCENPSAPARGLARLELARDNGLQELVAATNGRSAAIRLAGEDSGIPLTSHFNGQLLANLLLDALSVTG